MMSSQVGEATGYTGASRRITLALPRSSRAACRRTSCARVWGDHPPRYHRRMEAAGLSPPAIQRPRDVDALTRHDSTTLTDLRRAIPRHLFVPSDVRSFAALLRVIAVIGLLTWLTSRVEVRSALDGV